MLRVMISIWMVFTICACTTKGAYNNIKQNQCLEKTGKVYCDEIEDYESYERKREELLK